MFRRCVDLRDIALGVIAACALSACGSAPTVSESAPPAAAPAAEEPPAAQTFPLEQGTSTPEQTTRGGPAALTPTPTTTATPTRPADSSTATPTNEPPLPPEAVQQFDDAVAMVSAGNLAAAEGAFRSLSAAYPTYSGALVNLGILQAKAGRLDEAEKTLSSALERKADNAAAYNQLGIVYRRQGRFKEADEAYSRAVQIDPNYANAYLNLGVLCDLYLQQPQRALDAFERYLSLASTPDEKVGAWVKELKVRLGSNAQRSEGAGS